MKARFISLLLVTIVISTIFSSCCREDTETLPVVKTLAVMNVTVDSATVTGLIADNGNLDITSYGICWSAASEPTISDDKVILTEGTTEFECVMTLNPGQNYYVRAYATNALGTAYGNSMQVQTLGNKPSVEMKEISSLTNNSVMFNAKINGNSLMTKVSFEYGITSQYGLIVAVEHEANGEGEVGALATNLTPETVYHFRVKAENALGITYSDDKTFETKPALLTDIDGNSYQTVKIGNQIWMAENLKVTHYNDGTEVPNVTDQATWDNLRTGAYCYYNNDPELGKIYGALYNGYVVEAGKIAPKGWHVPSLEEWTTLSNYLGGYHIAGGKMKEAGYSHWIKPNVGATNSSGFNALPSGVCQGKFISLGEGCVFWSTTKMDGSMFFTPGLRETDSKLVLNGGISSERGLNVRLIKD